ncbi:hypothetical protein KGY63_05005, partial [Candidatus Bipolaricaulota bacterium]|nr:hypothetical protein [Candidatus Bipolaricaulota bacterium]
FRPNLTNPRNPLKTPRDISGNQSAFWLEFLSLKKAIHNGECFLLNPTTATYRTTLAFEVLW